MTTEHRSRGSTVLMALACLGVAGASVSAGYQVARLRGAQQAEAQVQLLVDEAWRRADATAKQIEWAITTLSAHQLEQQGPICDESSVDLMHMVDMSSAYLKAVGRVANGRLLCSTLGFHQPVALGEPLYVTPSSCANGLATRWACMAVMNQAAQVLRVNCRGGAHETVSARCHCDVRSMLTRGVGSIPLPIEG